MINRHVIKICGMRVSTYARQRVQRLRSLCRSIGWRRLGRLRIGRRRLGLGRCRLSLHRCCLGLGRRLGHRLRCGRWGRRGRRCSCLLRSLRGLHRLRWRRRRIRASSVRWAIIGLGLALAAEEELLANDTLRHFFELGFFFKFRSFFSRWFQNQLSPRLHGVLAPARGTDAARGC